MLILHAFSHVWELLGTSGSFRGIHFTRFHMFGSCWAPLGASCSVSTRFTCLGVFEGFWESQDAQGCPRIAQEASRAARKPLHTFFCVSERPMTLNPTCFTVPERPQEAPGGSFICEFTCGSSPPGERVGGGRRGVWEPRLLHVLCGKRVKTHVKTMFLQCGCEVAQ